MTDANWTAPVVCRYASLQCNGLSFLAFACGHRRVDMRSRTYSQIKISDFARLLNRFLHFWQPTSIFTMLFENREKVRKKVIGFPVEVGAKITVDIATPLIWTRPGINDQKSLVSVVFMVFCHSER